MTEWKAYQRTASYIEARPWKEGDDLDKVSISDVDLSSGSPKEGDMIFRNPDNHKDQWLVSKEYFSKHYTENNDADQL